MLALEVAASAPSPMNRPTQMALIVPFSDWRIEEASVGSAKASRVLAIGPWVRSPRPGLRFAAASANALLSVIPDLIRGLPFLYPPFEEGGSRLKAGMTGGAYPSRSNAARSRSASAAFAS